MTDPSKVLAFLDLAGAWDPSLAMVMVGGIAVGTFAFTLAAKRTRTLLGEVMRFPTATQIDGRLVLGGVLFGIGWGLGGYCPGPGLASLLTGGVKPLVFIIALVAGMATFEFGEQRATAAGKRSRKAP